MKPTTMVAVIAVAFFATIGVVSATEPARDKQDQQYAIDCVKAGGKMDFVFGSGTVCTK